MSTVNYTFDQLCSAYNSAFKRAEFDAVRTLGQRILEIARAQAADPHTAPEMKEKFQRWINSVEKTLSDLQSGKLQISRQTSSEKKIGVDAKAINWFSAEIPKNTLDDVAGLADVKTEFIINILAPLSSRYRSIYDKYRSDMGLQILLYGPPGTGKTHIVKCLAGQLGAKIAVVQIKDIMANLVGDGAKIIAEIFEQAKRYDKCIIFFDEIDAIAASRDDDESRHTKEQLTTLLTYMDGFMSGTRKNQIRIIIAATNRPWILDSAVKRGGRFETQIYVPLPDYDARKKLVEINLSKPPVPRAEDVTIEWLAERFEGYAGADIKAICKQIAGRPLRREIESMRAGRAVADRITRADCEVVMSKYINSITDEMLIQFDAYRQNRTFDEYVRILETKKEEELEPYVRRWLDLQKARRLQSSPMERIAAALETLTVLQMGKINSAGEDKK